MSHHCHAVGCTVAVPPSKLMCKRHWSMVPPALQYDVYEYYVPGQCNSRPSKEWLQAARAAINFVREREATTQREGQSE